ncbi:hypothetical protein QYE76_038696 [Lolium multiflorum]|uniref:Uncharacterized protein n=1 Tax=Lolium multiflorum TaxID=4521 RepID=A0AAD8T9G0_LOLMU|nr:hypothetical protein QYE76_038696 [Lolium multiflorum]
MAKSSSANATVSGLKTDETSNVDVAEVLMPSTTLDVTTSKGDIDQVATLAKPQTNATADCIVIAVPMVLGEELKDLEEKVRDTKELICDKAASIACSQQEAECLKAGLKTNLAEIRALIKQLVTGQDEDDEAEIAEVDHVRVSALCALEAFLQ